MHTRFEKFENWTYLYRLGLVIRNKRRLPPSQFNFSKSLNVILSRKLKVKDLRKIDKNQIIG